MRPSPHCTAWWGRIAFGSFRVLGEIRRRIGKCMPPPCLKMLGGKETKKHRVPEDLTKGTRRDFHMAHVRLDCSAAWSFLHRWVARALRHLGRTFLGLVGGQCVACIRYCSSKGREQARSKLEGIRCLFATPLALRCSTSVPAVYKRPPRKKQNKKK